MEMCMDMCIDVCIDMFWLAYASRTLRRVGTDTSTGRRADMCIGMHIATRIEMRMDINIGTCADMCSNGLYTYGHVW